MGDPFENCPAFWCSRWNVMFACQGLNKAAGKMEMLHLGKQFMAQEPGSCGG